MPFEAVPAAWRYSPRSAAPHLLCGLGWFLQIDYVFSKQMTNKDQTNNKQITNKQNHSSGVANVADE
jgi:hypothetical protein